VKIAHHPKAVILVIAVIGLLVLMLAGRVTTEAGLPIISAVVFYGIGNGVAARSGITSAPIIAPKEEKK
jgi:uncharacterized RDD family membrane protein YckC